MQLSSEYKLYKFFYTYDFTANLSYTELKKHFI